MFKRILTLALCVALIAASSVVAVTTNAASVEKSETSASTIKSASDFSWDNASVYFLLTDRFFNGNTSNDHSYNRSLGKDGKTVVKGNSDGGAFQGGDFAGITKKIEEGYFDDLGVNALWISAPYEQIHGYCIGGQGKSGSFPHYSYHGYYALDFSTFDKNYGTEKEFETMVDTAHKHGIRIVLDVVMNHVGYNTLYDMKEYGFGKLSSGWEDDYFNARLTDTNYHNCIDYNNDSSAWAKWWGGDWLRAGIAGYPQPGSDERTSSLTYLPDVRTENSSTVGIPQILQTKWQKDGTLSKKKAELDKYFQSGKSKTVRNYLVFWLTQYVEKYGVDGFRCDTAKHVELESWKALKDQGLKSLQTWRKNNPTKPGADWDENFWMTGECFPHYVNYDSYYTSGGFDSMINFSFNDSSTAFDSSGRGVPGASSINGTYADYAGKINTNDNFNVLTYLSSHDTALCRNDMIYQGSAFQLMPGAIQIYYGDETNRPLVGGIMSGRDHNLRSFMNWSSLDKNLLSHWQKVGKFRSNHVAVGAGSHTNLTASSGTAFARKYDKGGVKDAVACVIGAGKSTNVTITLNGTFPDGTTVKNAYDGKTATVSGGKVSFNSGANGTILVESASGSQPVTEAPTKAPTQAPTEAPTAAPTQAPTQAPTAAPTQAPSQAPSQTPETNAPASEAPTSQTPSQQATNAPSEDAEKYGDVNLDKKIDIRDVTMIQKYLAKLTNISELGLILANVDGKNNVNIKDATYIAKYIAKMSDTAKVGSAYGSAPAQPATQDATEAPVATQAATDAPSDTPATQAPEVTPTEAPATQAPEVTPTEPETEPVTDPPVESNAIYFKNTPNWDTVYCYMWTNGKEDQNAEWPGVAMTKGGDGVCSLTIDGSYAHVIFNNGGDPGKTGDLDFPGTGKIFDYTANSWQDYSGSGDSGNNNESTDHSSGDGMTIYFTNPNGWSEPHIHIWGDAGDLTTWPGEPMKREDDGRWSYVIPNGYNKCVINGDGSQTGDIEITSDGQEVS